MAKFKEGDRVYRTNLRGAAGHVFEADKVYIVTYCNKGDLKVAGVNWVGCPSNYKLAGTSNEERIKQRREQLAKDR